jgi:hypothetical protein
MSKFGDWIAARGFRIPLLKFRWGRGKSTTPDTGWDEHLKESNGRHAAAMRAVPRRLKKKGG